MAFHIKDQEADTPARDLARRRAEVDALMAEMDALPKTGLKADKAFFDELSGDGCSSMPLRFARFGKGRHPARLNMGDCFTYACAKTNGLPLLFKGNDFGQTDLEIVPWR